MVLVFFWAVSGFIDQAWEDRMDIVRKMWLFSELEDDNYYTDIQEFLTTKLSHSDFQLESY
jgi:hypothetical protein